MQRHQRADHAVQRGDGVADRDADAHRRPVGIAGDVAQPAHGLADGAEAGPVAVRPGLAETGEPHHDQPGIERWRAASQPSPHFSIAPGRKFSTTMSAPRGELAHDLLRFRLLEIERHRLLVARLRVPPERGALRAACATCAAGRRCRGGSILITSAPNSASMRAQNGPAINLPSSMTLTPSRGWRLAALMAGQCIGSPILISAPENYNTRHETRARCAPGPVPGGLRRASPARRRRWTSRGSRRWRPTGACATNRARRPTPRALRRCCPAAIAQVEAAHYRPFAEPVVVYVCAHQRMLRPAGARSGRASPPPSSTTTACCSRRASSSASRAAPLPHSRPRAVAPAPRAAARPLHHAHSGLVPRGARLARRRERRRRSRDRGGRAARDRGGRALPAGRELTTRRAASTPITGSSGSRCSTARA